MLSIIWGPARWVWDAYGFLPWGAQFIAWCGTFLVLGSLVGLAVRSENVPSASLSIGLLMTFVGFVFLLSFGAAILPVGLGLLGLAFTSRIMTAQGHQP